VVARSLLSVIPGGWVPGQLYGHGSLQIDHADDGDQVFATALATAHNYAALITPEFLVGAVAGVAMIIGAIWFRRWRDDG